MPRSFRRPHACRHLRTAVLVLVTLASSGALAGQAPRPAPAVVTPDPVAARRAFAPLAADCTASGPGPGAGFDHAIGALLGAARRELAATRAALVRGLADAKKIRALVEAALTTWSIRPARRAGARG